MRGKRAKKPFTVELQKEIEQVIGREIVLSRCRMVDFADLTDTDLIEFHTLLGARGTLIIDYLTFLLKEEIPFSMIMSFLIVVEQKITISEWLEKFYLPRTLKSFTESRNSD